MAATGLNALQEWAARLFLLLLLAALALGIVIARPPAHAITLRGEMPESGGWQPDHLTARVGQPLRLRLTSDDVVHSFAVGVGPDGQAHEHAPVDVYPGEVTALTLTFDTPGIYTFYCTRWCGPNHWRMRGTIEVQAASEQSAASQGKPAEPLYVQLGLDIDAPHPASVVPTQKPSAAQGADLAIDYPAALQAPEGYMTQSPIAVWHALRALPELAHLDDATLWNAVAYLWQRNTIRETLLLGERLYSQNCAACHGENGDGDGVFAEAGSTESFTMRGHGVEAATAFTNPDLLAASNALLQGKILRGGMGTGMPAWGAIFTTDELQALVDYLWTFQFVYE